MLRLSPVDTDHRKLVQAVNALMLPKGGTTAQRPAKAPTGFMYFDETVGKPIWWAGSGWKYADGTAA